MLYQPLSASSVAGYEYGNSKSWQFRSYFADVGWVGPWHHGGEEGVVSVSHVTVTDKCGSMPSICLACGKYTKIKNKTTILSECAYAKRVLVLL